MGLARDAFLLAHDAQRDEFLDAANRPHGHSGVLSHRGAHDILPGVEIGPRTVVGANSLVASSLPPNTVCVGSPARVISTLEEYLEKHRTALERSARFPYLECDIRFATPERRAEMARAVADRDTYVVGGRSAELRGLGEPREPLRRGTSRSGTAFGCRRASVLSLPTLAVGGARDSSATYPVAGMQLA